jgi:hypothetical protein
MRPTAQAYRPGWCVWLSAAGQTIHPSRYCFSDGQFLSDPDARAVTAIAPDDSITASGDTTAVWVPVCAEKDGVKATRPRVTK